MLKEGSSSWINPDQVASASGGREPRARDQAIVLHVRSIVLTSLPPPRGIPETIALEILGTSERCEVQFRTQ